MDELITIQPAPTLRGFCQHIIAKYAGNWPPSEDLIAEGFVTFFKLDYLATFTFTGLTGLCGALGINVSVTKLPAGLRGHNCAFEDKREIVIAEPAATAVFGSREHTLLHELREIIEHEFIRLKSPIATDLLDREQRADDFASDMRAMTPLKTFNSMLDYLGTPKWTFGGVCFAIFGAALMLFFLLNCTMLPHWEDQLPG